MVYEQEVSQIFLPPQTAFFIILAPFSTQHTQQHQTPTLLVMLKRPRFVPFILLCVNFCMASSLSQESTCSDQKDGTDTVLRAVVVGGTGATGTLHYIYIYTYIICHAPPPSARITFNLFLFVSNHNNITHDILDRKRDTFEFICVVMTIHA